MGHKKKVWCEPRKLRQLRTDKLRIQDKINYHTKQLKALLKEKSVISLRIAVMEQTKINYFNFDYGNIYK